MNNDQIDNTSYYQLPCGKQLEDYIAWRGLDFATGSALKYLWRAGKKDGETGEKDLAKHWHYVERIADREGNVSYSVSARIRRLKLAAMAWEGGDK